MEPGPCPKAAVLFLDCSSLVSSTPPFPDEQLFEPALWTSGKVTEAVGSPTGSCPVSETAGVH